MKQRDSRAAAIAVGAAGFALLSTGTAYAYWTATGAGSGQADVGEGIPLTTQAAVVTGELYPAGPDVAGTVAVTNPNAFPVEVRAISFADPETTTAGCTPTGVTFADDATLAVTIASGATAEIPYSASMTTASPDGCQGATFTADYQLTAVSK